MSTYEIGTYYIYAKFSTAHYLQAEEYIYVLKKMNARTTRITLDGLLRGKITIMLKIKKFSKPF